MVRNHRRFADNIALMNGIADKLIQERKADPEALATKNDLLNHMLVGIDKQSGESLDDLNIRYQLITFLIAGHETTSGLLSFALYYLLKNPDALQRGREEVDRILGDDPTVAPTYAQVNRLTYVGQILKEALRLLRPGAFGGMLNFGIKGDAAVGSAVVDAMKLASNLANVGQCLSSVTRASRRSVEGMMLMT